MSQFNQVQKVLHLIFAFNMINNFHKHFNFRKFDFKIFEYNIEN